MMNEDLNKTGLSRGRSLWWAFLGLVGVGVLSGVLWRFEIELRGGRTGVGWACYFHWAPLVSAAGFWCWLMWWIRVRRPWRLGLALVGFGTLAFSICCMTQAFLTSRFPFGPDEVPFAMLGPFSGLVSFGLECRKELLWELMGKSGGELQGAEGFLGLSANARGAVSLILFVTWLFGIPLALWLSVPLGLCRVLRGFGVPVKRWATLASAGLFVLSWPLAVLGYGLSRGEIPALEWGVFVDQNALKSGWIFPFLVLALGFPALPGCCALRLKPAPTGTAP